MPFLLILYFSKGFNVLIVHLIMRLDNNQKEVFFVIEERKENGWPRPHVFKIQVYHLQYIVSDNQCVKQIFGSCFRFCLINKTIFYSCFVYHWNCEELKGHWSRTFSLSKTKAQWWNECKTLIRFWKRFRCHQHTL